MEMKILRWFSKHIGVDKMMKNGHTQKVGVSPIDEKMEELCLKDGLVL